MADDDTPRNADFIGRVVRDPKNPPETRMLTGWLGDAAEEGYRRLYTDAELSAYIDVPSDAILHSEPIRDAQPAGGVFVWIQRNAALKPGGSAASRAARFLQGQVTQDFACGGGSVDLNSPEKAGYRCVTQMPCGEPTGFTGQCTNQPEVGGAWPCITAIPHCTEPTGFTGQCTHQPWPHPTRYVGCTIFHCPTRDLTHIPAICNIVVTGMSGCGVIDPRGGGDQVAKADAAGGGPEGGGGAAAPATSLPGCGYTQTWGLCETQLLGCGFTQQWGCQPTQPPKCNVSVDIPCITQTETPQCQGMGGFAAFAAAAPGHPFAGGGGGQQFFGGAAQGLPAGQIGTTATLRCTQFGLCPPFFTLFANRCEFVQDLTLNLQCQPTHPPQCPRTVLGCPPTANCLTPHCPPSDLVVICTFVGPQCPTLVAETAAGPQCQPPASGPPPFCPQSRIAICTFVGPQCPTPAVGTVAGPQCQQGGGAQFTPLTVPLQCQLPTPATHCFICPPHSRLPWLCPPITQTFVCGGGA